jgi:hypothetical protein
MKDITSVGEDLVVIDAATPKAANVLQIRQGSLEYAPDFGIDLDFFLDEEFRFQNESFKAYLIQRLAEHYVNVSELVDENSIFERAYTFYVGDAETDASGGFIR